MLDETRDEKWEQMFNDAEMYIHKNRNKFVACAEQLLLEKTRFQQLSEGVGLYVDKNLHMIHGNRKNHTAKL